MPSTVKIEGPEPNYDGYVERQFSLPPEIAIKLCKITAALQAEGVQCPYGANRQVLDSKEALFWLIDSAEFV